MKTSNSETGKLPVLTVENVVKADLKKVWDSWTNPKHIMQWCQASDDWHAPYAENDLREGGVFKTTMAAKDGSFSFDFGGTYSVVKPMELIEYRMEDGRQVSTRFTPANDGIKIVEQFEAESENPLEMQQGGWQAILDNFKKYTESL